MCDPFTLMAVGTAVSAAGSLASGYMGMQAGKANAAGYRQQAILREEKAKYDSAQAITRFERTQGQAVANIGTTGLSIESFSDVLADSAVESALEVEAIKWQGHAEANNLRFQAATQEYQGKAAMISGIFSAVGQAAGGMGKAMGMQGSPMNGVGYSPWSYQVNRFTG